MKQSGFWKKAKRVLAILLAFMLLLSGKNNFSLFAKGADGQNSVNATEEPSESDKSKAIPEVADTEAAREKTVLEEAASESVTALPQEVKEEEAGEAAKKEPKEEAAENGSKEQKEPEADKTDNQEPKADKADNQEPEADKADNQEPEADKTDNQEPEEPGGQLPNIRDVNVSDEDSWTASKTVTITAANASDTTEGLRYYYAVSDVLSDAAMLPEKLPEGITATGNQAQDNSFVVADGQNETGTTYYIYVADAQKHVVKRTVQVKKIDPSEPALSVTGNSCFIGNGNGNTGSVTVKLTAWAASGIKSIKYRKDSGDWTDVEISNGSAEAALTFTEAGVYEFQAANGAGALKTETYTVFWDSQAPSINIKSVVHDKGFTAQDENGKYYFSGSLNVALTVAEEAETDAAHMPSKITITRSSGSSNSVLQEITPSGAVHQEVSDTTITESGTYVYTVSDEVGHSAFVTVIAEKVEDPKLSVTISCHNNPKEIDGDQVYADLEKIGFKLDISDNIGIASIEYKEKPDAEFKKIYPKPAEEGAAGQNPTALKEYSDIFVPEEKTFEDGGSYSYHFRVVDAVGDEMESTLTFKVDSSAPDTSAYIIYDTDAEGKTDKKAFSGGSASKIFGRDTVTFYLLVKDKENGGYRSGIDTDALLNAIQIPKGFTAKEGSLSVLEDTAVKSEAIEDAEGYTVLKGTLTHGLNESVLGKLKLNITELKDRAGNTAKLDSDDIKELEADAVLFLDNCAPKLRISYGETKREEDVFYEKDTKELTLIVEEAFYDKNQDKNGNVIAPTVILKKSEDNGVTWTEAAAGLDWIWKASQNEAFAVLTFPAEADKEMIYQFTAAYQDGSKNLLTADTQAQKEIPQGSWDEQAGTFTSLPVVVDQKLPEVTELVIAEDEKDLDEDKNSILTNSEEVKITGIVTDTHLKSVALYKEDGSDSGIKPEVSEDEGRYTWSIRAEEYLKEKYHVMAEDYAGNQNTDPLVLSVEIDHIVPRILGIEKDSQEWADAHGQWSNTDTTFTITVENDNNSSAIPKLRYKKDGDDTILEAEGKRKEPKDEEDSDKDIWIFTCLEADETFKGNYYFQAYDALENGKADEIQNWRACRFQKDKVKADVTNIYAVYEDYTTDTSHGNMIKELFARALSEFKDTELGEKLYSRLFVKTKIKVTLGIRDEISGVKSIQYTYPGKDPKKAKSAAVSEDTLEYEGVTYQAFYFELEGEGSADTLTITSIEDVAGNIIECSEKPDDKMKGTTLLVIDNTAPTLDISYPECTGEQEKPMRRYYRPLDLETYEEVVLTFTERYLDKQVDMDTGKVVLPEIKVYRNDETEAMDLSSLLKPGTKWEAGAWNHADGTIQAVLQLPYSDQEEEIEYRLEVSYQDGSQNMLALAAADPFGSIAEGNDTYIGGTMILDTKAPDLTSCEIIETPNRITNDGIPVYLNQAGTNDVTIRFVVEDNQKYWNPDAWKISVMDVTHSKTVTNDSSLIQWVNNGDKHQGTVAFDGEAGVEANYQVVLSYEDYAKNKMILNASVAQGEISEGVYTSAQFILDHVAPVVSVYFSEAYQVIDKNNKTVKNQNIPLSGNYRSYYGKSQGSIKVTVELKETYLITDENQTNGILDFSFKVNGVETAMDGEWVKSQTTYTRSYTIIKDGDYKLAVSYQDAAANVMEASERVEGGKVAENGSYQSSELILDTAAPVLTRSYSIKPENTLPADGRIYFKQNAALNVEIVDQNIRYKELRDPMMKMEAVDLAGNQIKDNSAQKAIAAIEPDTVRSGEKRGQWSIEIPLHTEANYTIPLSYTDLAGNKAEFNSSELVTVDKTQPQFQLSYNINDPVNYKKHGYLFSRTKMTVKATASDETSGIHLITFIITDEDGDVTTKTKTINPSAGNKEYKVTIPLKSADFKGTIKAEVYDWSANSSKQTRDHIVESGEKHNSTAEAVIKTKTAPSRTVNGKDFYNTDVQFNLKISDSYSGIRSLSYTGGKTLEKSVNYAEQAGTDLNAAKPSQEVTYVYSEDLALDSKQNNENEVMVHAEYEDNTGHTGKVEETYNIDITVPVIKVEYDLNDPSDEKFYNQTRTATVTIQERNFDEKDVEFTITNTDGAMPSISGWTSSGTGDETYNTCKVSFGEDGDYTFTLAFQDLAGNKAVYDVVDEFTIDQTKPQMSVSYDNNAAKNEYYYDKSRTATIDILEHNFDPAHIEVTIGADTAGAPSLSGWSKNGDHNIATVTYSDDADYTFDISGMDQAENPLDDYQTDRFVVDQTPPELEIFDIENMSANNGIVMPGVRYSDTNYDADATEIKMKGFKNGEQQMNGTANRTAEGMEIKLNDFEHTPEMDDLYTMEATVYDKAGNSSEAKTMFSVNRFGSVYSYDETTDGLVGSNGKYYTNEEQDIVVTETNVDTLEFKEITCSLNGALRTMVEGEDYTVSESGNEVSWKQYTYTMDRKNFEEEGTYIINIYSEDRATNTSDNNTKGRKIEFVMDTTKPSVLISGVENEGQYRENSREITLDVQDNILLADVEIQVDKEKTSYTAQQVADMDGKITYTAGSANQWQEMTVTALDAAGNQYTSDKMRFLVTANVLVQFYMNKPLFYGVLAAIAVLGAGIFLIVAKRKKKGKETTEQG